MSGIEKVRFPAIQALTSAVWNGAFFGSDRDAEYPVIKKWFRAVAQTLDDPDRLPQLATLSLRTHDDVFERTETALQLLRDACKRRGVSLKIVVRAARIRIY